MNRRIKLPVVEEEAAPEATVEVLRRSLGGPLLDDEGATAGRAVALAAQPERPLVVLFEDADSAHLWVGQGRVRKVPRAGLLEFRGSLPADLAAIARDIRRLHTMTEGTPVGVLLPEPPGATGRGVLLEKCRFGGLVRISDGRLLAVGFRRLWPEQSMLN